MHDVLDQGSPTPGPQAGSICGLLEPGCTAGGEWWVKESRPIAHIYRLNRSVNPPVNCTCEGCRLRALYGNHPQTTPLSCLWKNVFHETSPWFQKGWGLLF